jgi:predicted porin
VTISGNADVGFVNKAAYGGNGNLFSKSSGVADGLNSPNRIILTVKEDLGGGMTATFYNEHGISPTNTNDWGSRTTNGAPQVIGVAKNSAADDQIPSSGSLTTSTNRGTYVGLADAKMGEIRAGFLVSSLYNTSAQSGYFLGVEQYGALLKDHGMAEVGGSRANGLQYTTPKLGMFTGTVQKQYGGERTYTSDAATAPYSTNKQERTALRADMDAGALKATYVRTELTKLQTAVGGTPANSIFGVAGTAPSASADQKAKHDHLSAIYTYGPVAATYQYNKLDLTDNLTAGSSRNGKSNQYGIQYTVGAASVYAITGKANMDSPTARVNDITNTQYGVRYNLSKRTLAYFMAGTSKDSVPTAADKMSKGTMSGVGVMHAF